LAWVTSHFPRTRHLIDGRSNELIHDGQWVDHHVRKELITKDAVLAEANQAGINRLEDIASFVIEPDGTPTDRRHGESPELAGIHAHIARLDTLEQRLGMSPPDDQAQATQQQKTYEHIDPPETKSAPPATRAHEPGRERDN